MKMTDKILNLMNDEDLLMRIQNELEPGAEKLN